jgi:microcystin-dependent protein
MPEITGRLRTPRLSTAPANPVEGEMYYDVEDDTLYTWNGLVWTSGGGMEVYEQPDQPLSTTLGAVWIDTDEPAARSFYDSDQVGTVKAFAGVTIPANWVLADGRTLARASYPQLADALGVPSGNTTFTIPDLRNRFLYGASSPGVGASGGAATHTLSAAEMPTHTHVSDSRINESPAYSSGGNVPVPPGYGAGGAKQAMADSIGGGGAHNNMPPYTLVAFIIKVAGPQIDPGGSLVGPPGAPGLIPTYGTSFPASPLGGAEHVLVDSTSNPSYQWRFRYNPNSSSAYKWEFIGGPPARSGVDAGEQPTANGVWQNLATNGPAITIPRPGEYEISWSCRNVRSKQEAQSAYCGVAIGDTTPQLGYLYWFYSAVAVLNSEGWHGSHSERATVLNAGDVLKMRYYGGNNSGTAPWAFFSVRRLLVLPVRCS